MEGFKDSSSKRRRYNYTVVIQYYAIKRGEHVTVLVVWAQFDRQVRFWSGKAVLDFVQKLHHAGVARCGRTDVIP